jgi:hypothetical protein
VLIADSTSLAGASVAYCKALLKSDGCARMPWNSGFNRSDVVCDFAGRLETASNSAGADAAANLVHDARQMRSFKLLPARRFCPPLWAGSRCRYYRPLAFAKPMAT